MEKLEKNSKYLFILSLLIYTPISIWNTIMSARELARENLGDAINMMAEYEKMAVGIGIVGTAIFIVLAYFIYRAIYRKINRENEYMIARFKDVFFLNMAVLYAGGTIVMLLNRFIISGIGIPILPIALGIKILLLIGLNSMIIEGEENRPVANTAAFSVLALF